MTMNNKPRLIIIGASGHGKVVADIASLNGFDDIVFLDDNESIKECGGYPVVGATNKAGQIEGFLFVAVGNNFVRNRIMENNKGRVFPILVHPSATLASNVEIGEGSVIMAGAVVGVDARVGKGCIVNTLSSVDHDCIIKDYVHVAVGAHVCGTVYIEENTWVGAGATIINNLSVCSDCMIGAGAVVVKNIDVAGTYVGVPARMCR